MSDAAERRHGAFYGFYFTEFPEEPLHCLEEDRDALASIVQKMTDSDEDADIVEYYDQTSAEFEESLSEIQTEVDDTAPDFLFVYILSHGDEKANLKTMDGEKPLMDVLAKFRDEACPRFTGRPKIFLVQACRGHRPMPRISSRLSEAAQPSHSARLKTQASVERPTSVKQVDMNNELLRIRRNLGDNFLVAYATPPGRYAYYQVDEGSQFTQHLRKAVHEHTEGLMQLMVRANRSMSRQTGLEEVCYFVSRLHEDFPMHCRPRPTAR